MEGKGLEVKVGLVALGAIALLVVFVVLLGDFSFSKTHTLHVTFDFAGGIESGAQVKVTGFRAGKVKSVDFIDGEIDPETQEPVHIKVTLQIDDKIWPSLREGSRFHINTQGLIGEQYIEIEPGPFKGTQIAEGTVIRGVDPVRTDLFIGKAYGLLQIASGLFNSGEGKEVAESLRSFLKSASSLLTVLAKSFEGREQEIGELVTHVNELIQEATSVARSVNAGLGDGQQIQETFAQVQSLLRKATTVADDIEDLLATADKYLEPTLKDARDALADIRTATNTATKVLSDLNADPEQIKRAINDVTQAASRLDSITADVQSVIKEIKSGDGTVGLLLRDSAIYDDLKEMLRDLKKNPWKFLWKE
jgi:phospholipid/cholesterol/gamma-HCH transport system substrate-binding protein